MNFEKEQNTLNSLGESSAQYNKKVKWGKWEQRDGSANYKVSQYHWGIRARNTVSFCEYCHFPNFLF